MVLLAGRADGRADITNYFTGFGWRPPNSFEPSGHGVPGNSAETVTNGTGNWTIFSNMGNLGIGNGSTATFGDPFSPPPSNYSDNLFQAGDVSQQPLDPARELNLPVAAPAAVESNASDDAKETNAAEGNAGAAQGSSGRFPIANAGQPSPENETRPASENATEVEASVQPSLTPENATFAAYHPIWAGRPVNDLLYEHPLANSISMYSRLVGLATPSGIPINIAMRCLGYGY